MTTPTPDKLEIPDAAVEAYLDETRPGWHTDIMQGPMQANARLLLTKLLPHMPDRGYAEGIEAAAKVARDNTPDKHNGTLAAHVTGATIEAAISALATPAPADNGSPFGHDYGEGSNLHDFVDALEGGHFSIPTPSRIEDVAPSEAPINLKLAKLRFFRDMVDADRAKVFTAFFGPEIAAEATTHGLQSMLFDHMVGDFAARRVRPSPVDKDARDGVLETIAVPKEAIDWLMGAGPDPAGLWFGDFPDDHPKPAGAFWWRRTFNDICDYVRSRDRELQSQRKG